MKCKKCKKCKAKQKDFLVNNYRYILEPYKSMKSRYTCPNGCLGKTYTRYLDKEIGQHLPYEYGKCERLNKCGYHLNPYKNGYSKMIWLRENDNNDWRKVPIESRPTFQSSKPEGEPTFICRDIFEKSLDHYEHNSFVKYLIQLFDPVMAMNLVRRFHLGTSKYPKGKEACVFWLIDDQSNIVGGQVIAFDKEGHTLKEDRPDGSKKRFNSWVHIALKKSYQRANQPLPDWLQKYITNNPKFPCLFGLPQLLIEPLAKPIAIVESAKTAIIASAYLPQYIWLAVGSLSYLNESRLSVLQGRNITLFPDKGGYELWEKKISQLSGFANFIISNLLERKEAEEGADLADYLTVFDLSEFTPKQSKVKGLEQISPPKTKEAMLTEKKCEKRYKALPVQKTPCLPEGWSRNSKGKLVDIDGLIVLDWWADVDLENSHEIEKKAVIAEFLSNSEKVKQKKE